MSPDEAFHRLVQGNDNFLNDVPFSGPTNRECRLQLASEQHPFAAYLSCSDSRVSPELLFGRGLGELFIVRNAGNTLGATALGSLEFAVTNLQVPLIVVMGHRCCGAVRAAVAMVRDGAEFSPHVRYLLEPLAPAVPDDPSLGHDELVERAVLNNVRRVVAELKSGVSPSIAEAEASGRLRIVGAHYCLESGRVDFI